MSPSFRQQISSTLNEAEHRLNRLQTQPQTDPRLIEGEQREIEILRRKLGALPEDTPEPALTH